MLARDVQQVPGEVVLLVADPDVEVVEDPASGEEVRKGVAGRMALEVFADLHRPNARRLQAPFVQGPQEGYAAAGIMLPAVFAIHDDGDQGGVPAGDGLADGPRLGEKVVRRVGPVAPLIVEADQVA